MNKMIQAKITYSASTAPEEENVLKSFIKPVNHCVLQITSWILKRVALAYKDETT